ncbi:hypothetical protein ACI2LC_42450 [Nonomuraea wenchangensis]|uniref:hypothetical protein n=1 Tax=Nonomuraea wenchangensis TaxID=568860 RepID=UPI0037B25FCC
MDMQAGSAGWPMPANRAAVARVLLDTYADLAGAGRRCLRDRARVGWFLRRHELGAAAGAS